MKPPGCAKAFTSAVSTIWISYGPGRCVAAPRRAPIVRTYSTIAGSRTRPISRSTARAASRPLSTSPSVESRPTSRGLGGASLRSGGLLGAQPSVPAARSTDMPAASRARACRLPPRRSSLTPFRIDRIDDSPALPVPLSPRAPTRKALAGGAWRECTQAAEPGPALSSPVKDPSRRLDVGSAISPAARDGEPVRSPGRRCVPGQARSMKRSALDVDIVSLSDVGQKRSTNQDAYGSFVRPGGERLLVIADGMGGHRGGEIASQVAVAAIEAAFEASSAAPDELLLDAFQEANVRVRERAHREPALAGMGTTGVALWLGRKGRAWVAHVGDSRAYRLRDGVLEPLTADHSVVGELLRRGLLSPAEADAHPRRNELIRSIGAMEEMEIDVAQVDARPGDRFLLCSDGLCCVVDDAEIGQVLSRASTDEAAHELIEIAKARGGPDNITVQIVAVGGRTYTSATLLRAAVLLAACALVALAALLWLG